MAEGAGEGNPGGIEIEARLEQIKSELAAAKLPQRRRLLLERKGLEEDLRAKLSAIDRVRLARNPARPQTQDYIDALITGFIELHGDRRYADDGAIIAGLGFFGQRPVAIAGHQRGRSNQAKFWQTFSRGLS
jgi:acetyl-CoA carboxylase carboxyl transferase subunit alpha